MSLKGIERINRRQMDAQEAERVLRDIRIGQPDIVYYKCLDCTTMLSRPRKLRGRRALRCNACIATRHREKPRESYHVHKVKPTIIQPQEVGKLQPPRRFLNVEELLSKPGVASIAFPISHKIFVGQNLYEGDTLIEALGKAAFKEGW